MPSKERKLDKKRRTEMSEAHTKHIIRTMMYMLSNFVNVELYIVQYKTIINLILLSCIYKSSLSKICHKHLYTMYVRLAFLEIVLL